MDLSLLTPLNNLNIYVKKKFNSVTYKNDFLITLYIDKITIMYNTSLNLGEEIYHISTKNTNSDDNNNGATIHNRGIEIIEEENKKEQSSPKGSDCSQLAERSNLPQRVRIARNWRRERDSNPRLPVR